ncbi:MAG TPA: right-handed parallel beta-helix repeat-containing protein, partial [Pirellulaceae bacterium]|nr:right-handed parallel beta-helix repeat-containing protein [Pirellulaceae bacterium]
AERGEMVTDVPSQTGFDSVGSTGTLVGEYELEVRRSAIYGHNFPFAPPLQLPFRSFDTNDRLSQQSTITVPQGPDIYDGQTFVLSDGVDTLTFEFDDDDLDLIGFTDLQTGFGDGVAAGRVLVPFRPNWEDYQVAASVRDVVNSNQVQAVLEIIAGLSDGKITSSATVINSTTDRVNLYGNVTANVFSERGVDDFGDPIATGVEEMSVKSFGVGEHGYSPPNGFSYPDFSGEYGGDQNRQRDEGQLLIHSNFVSRSGQFGIFIDADDRTAQGSIPNPGGVRHTRGINQERLVHSVTVINNVLDRNTSGGIRFSGQSNPNNQPQAPVPFGRIVNNTVYGLAQGDIGIRVDTSASPTVLNNILANLGTGVLIDGTSQTSVIGSNLYQNAPTAVNEFSPIELVAGDPLFLDAAASNFYLTSGSQAIDSSLDSLNDRFDFFNSIKQPLGIAASPILAPDRDVVGQLRADGDGNSSGGGSNPLKDRGAFDRVDEFGPTAELLFPRDNDTTGDDIDATETVVRLTEGVLDHFDIVLFDGEGTGPDVNTLTNLSVSLTEDG